MKLVIVSHVVHYRHAGRIYAYAPYAREVEVWADLFDEVAIAAPLRRELPPGDCDIVGRVNVEILPQKELGGETWTAKAKLALQLPGMVWNLSQALRQGDAIHVRCPGNLGLLGALLAPFFSTCLVAKFAGQWNANPKDPLSVRFQRALLRSPWWRGPVTIYGRWPDLPAHIVPFFSAALTAGQITQADAAARERTSSEARNILFVGRLSRSKNVDVLLKALKILRDERIPFSCTIAGSGPERSSLETLSHALFLDDCVEFTGGLCFDRVLKLYERSGILVLASQTEGWPKAITEAMAFGLIVVGSSLGIIPEMLGEERGFVVPPGDANALAGTLRQVLLNLESYSPMRERAAAWARGYSLDSLGESLRILLTKHWGARAVSSLRTRPISSAPYVHE